MLLLVLCASFMLASIVFAAFLKRLGKPIDERLPRGILSVEVPWTPVNAKRIHDLLGPEGLAAARKQTKFDFVFLILYSLALSFACTLIATSLPGNLQTAGVMLAWAVLAAGATDAVENVAMLRMLDGRTNTPWPQLSTICAFVKFTIVLSALAFLGTGLTVLAYTRWFG